MESMEGDLGKVVHSQDLPVLTSTMPPITPEEQARLLQKIDWQLLPILTLLYLMSFLDRTSIGNAKIAKMDQELGLSPGQYNIALSVMFVSYVSFEVSGVYQIGRQWGLSVARQLWLLVLIANK